MFKNKQIYIVETSKILKLLLVLFMGVMLFAYVGVIIKSLFSGDYIMVLFFLGFAGWLIYKNSVNSKKIILDPDEMRIGDFRKIVAEGKVPKYIYVGNNKNFAEAHSLPDVVLNVFEKYKSKTTDNLGVSPPGVKSMILSNDRLMIVAYEDSAVFVDLDKGEFKNLFFSINSLLRKLENSGVQVVSLYK